MSLGGRENGKKRGREEKRKVGRDRKGKRNSLVSLFFIRALISSLGLTLRISSKPNYIPKALSMSTITLGAEIRTSKYELVGWGPGTPCWEVWALQGRGIAFASSLEGSAPSRLREIPKEEPHLGRL